MKTLDKLNALLASVGEKEWELGEAPTLETITDENRDGWVDIDCGAHMGALLAVWRMEDDERTPKCEDRVQLVIATMNALPKLIKCAETLEFFTSIYFEPHHRKLAQDALDQLNQESEQCTPIT